MFYFFIPRVPLFYLAFVSTSVLAQSDPFAAHVVKDAAALSPSELPDFEEYRKDPDHAPIIHIQPKTLTYALKDRDKVIVLDTRSKAEYDISHIKEAHWVGYEEFSAETVWEYHRDARVVVYSSNNKRAAIVAQYLKMMGFTDVELLEGGLIGWKNLQYDVYDAFGKTDKIHVGSKDNFKLLHYGMAVF